MTRDETSPPAGGGGGGGGVEKKGRKNFPDINQLH